MRTCDVPQVTPEGILQADTGLVPVDHDGVLYDCRFHPPSLIALVSTQREMRPTDWNLMTKIPQIFDKAAGARRRVADRN